MAVHDNFVDLMDRLVVANGRTVNLRRQTGAVLKDPANPHLGYVESTTDTPVSAVFLDNDQRDLLLALPGRPDQLTTAEREIDRLVLIAAKTLAFEITGDILIVDADGSLWEITEVHKLQPGPTLIGYTLEVGR